MSLLWSSAPIAGSEWHKLFSSLHPIPVLHSPRALKYWTTAHQLPLSVDIVLVPFLWNTWLITSSWNKWLVNSDRTFRNIIVNTVEKCRETSKNMHDAVQLRQFQRNPASVASHDELQGIIGSFKSNSLIDFSKQS